MIAGLIISIAVTFVVLGALATGLITLPGQDTSIGVLNG